MPSLSAPLRFARNQLGRGGLAVAERLTRSPAGLPPGPPIPRAAQLVAWAYTPIQFIEWCKSRFNAPFTIGFPGYYSEVIFWQPDAIKEIFTGKSHDLHAGEVNAVLEPLVGPNSVLLLDRERHMTHRKLLLPPFHGQRMHAYANAMREATDAAIDRCPLQVAFPLHEITQEITLDVIMQTVMGVTDSAAFEELKVLLKKLLDATRSPALLIKPLQRDLGDLTPWRGIMETSDRINALLFALFAERRKSGSEGREDILSMLIEAEDEDGKRFTDEELRDEMMTLLVAGHETTATSIAWAIYRLLANPRVKTKLQDELTGVVGQDAIGAEHLPKLEYLDAVIKETMRLNPVIPMVGRVLQRPMTIGGLDLPAGVAAVPCVYLAHRNPDVYSDPLTFHPERFVGRRSDPYTYLPFGGGIRRCIGMAFAMFEMKIVLAQFMLRTELELIPGYRGRVTRRSITFTPEGGMPVVVKKRRPAC